MKLSKRQQNAHTFDVIEVAEVLNPTPPPPPRPEYVFEREARDELASYFADAELTESEQAVARECYALALIRGVRYEGPRDPAIQTCERIAAGVAKMSASLKVIHA